MSGLRTVLMFSRFFPPRFDIGGKRAYRFARYLPEFGWRAAIITDTEPPPAHQDATAGLPLSAVNSVYRTYYPSWWPERRSGDSDGTIDRPTRRRRLPPQGLGDQVRWHTSIPAGRDIWLAPRAAWMARRLARREGASALFATSSPSATLIFGVAARLATGLPLCLDLRDPWSMNFLQRSKSPFTRSSEAWLEGQVLQAADRVTLTCESAVSAYRRLYPGIPSERFSCIYNGYDPEQRPDQPGPPSGPITLVHFGNCYGERRLETVLLAVAMLRDEGWTPRDLRVVNLGRMAAEDAALMARRDLAGFVDARAFVPYEQGLRILGTADLQLLLSYGEEQLFVPAKLYDYLLSGAPILCIAPRSELTEIVARTGAGRSADPGEPATVVQIIRDARAARSGGPTLAARDESEVARFSARNTARELARLLDGMVGEVGRE